MYDYITSSISLQHCLTVQFCLLYFLCSTLISGVIHYAVFTIVFIICSLSTLIMLMTMLNKFHYIQFSSFRFGSFNFSSIVYMIELLKRSLRTFAAAATDAKRTFTLHPSSRHIGTYSVM